MEITSLLAAVHPRVRGEHRLTEHARAAQGCSSPRARGTLCPALIGLVSVRFIPAGAGNTTRSGPSITAVAVHPRGRGEHYYAARRTQGIDGSSPRVRGTRALIRPSLIGQRFIPACAGNTILTTPLDTRVMVHPRVCGEHPAANRLGCEGTGSSPRARGTQAWNGPNRSAARFIPACAGNTPRAPPPSQSSAVHPRVCGEHPGVSVPGSATTGSSPRARGTLGSTMSHGRRYRFHPRGRGEHALYPRFVDAPNGSSPRARGTLRITKLCIWLLRFIPARAGNTDRTSGCCIDLTVHPRACGEHLQLKIGSSDEDGSSPRVRGTRIRNWRRIWRGGSSPRVRGTLGPA